MFVQFIVVYKQMMQNIRLTVNRIVGIIKNAWNVGNVFKLVLEKLKPALENNYLHGLLYKKSLNGLILSFF